MTASRRRCRTLAVGAVAAGAAVTTATCVLLRIGLLPLGIVGQWTWPLRSQPLTIQPATVAGFVVVIGAAWYVLHLVRSPQPPKRDQTALGVLICCLAAFGLMMGLYQAEPHPYLRAAQAACATHALPYYEHAMATSNLGDLMRGYGDFDGRMGLPDRLRTHPPGPVVYFYHARALVLGSPALLEFGGGLMRSDGVPPEHAPALLVGYTTLPLSGNDMVAGLLTALLLTLTGCAIPALLALTARAIVTSRTALLAALLAATIPSVLLFVPSINGFGVVLGLSALAAYLWALRRGSWVLGALSGLLWAATFFWSIGLLFMALPAAGVLWHLVMGRASESPSAPDDAEAPIPQSPLQLRTGAGPVAATVAALAVFSALFLVLYLALGYNAVANVAEIMRAQEQIMAGAERDRLTWLFMNIYEFALFMGPMLLLTSLAGFACALTASRCSATDEQAESCEPVSQALRYFGFGLLLAFVLLDVSGSTLGEVGRIWVFLMPLFALFAADAARHLQHRLWPWYLLPIVLAQAAYTYCLLAAIVPVQPY